MANYTAKAITKDSDTFYLKDYAYQQIFTCDTAADVAIKEVTATNVSVVAGITIKVKFTYANTASSISLKVNGTAKTIYAYGSTTVKNYWHANEIVEFTYDGTYWYMKDISLTDEKVKQNVTDTSYGRSILLTNNSNSNGTGGPSTTTTGSTYFATDVYVQPSTGTLGATILRTNKYHAPTSSGGSTYGVGSSGQVLTSNGTTTYWATPTGGISGPSSSTDGYLVLWDGTTGAAIKNSAYDPAALAPLASPALTGTPTAPTATAGTNTTQIATTAFVTTAVSNAGAGTEVIRLA